jgi:hypothetical protein
MNTINLTAPRNYGEMTEAQVRYLAALQVSGMSEETIWTKCFIRFTGIKVISGTSKRYLFAKKHLKGFFRLSIEEVLFFSKRMNFLTKRFVGIRPMAKIGKYQVCDELLRDTTFIQYLEAENFYQAFLYTKDDVHLYKLMATLYQAEKEYDNNLTDKKLKYFARHTSETEKLIIVMWMIGIKEYFSNQFKYLFGRMEVDDEYGPTAPDMYSIIQNQIRLLTDGDITKREKVLSSNTWDALEEINAKIREAQELKKQNQN